MKPHLVRVDCHDRLVQLRRIVYMLSLFAKKFLAQIPPYDGSVHLTTVCSLRSGLKRVLVADAVDYMGLLNRDVRDRVTRFRRWAVDSKG